MSSSEGEMSASSSPASGEKPEFKFLYQIPLGDEKYLIVVEVNEDTGEIEETFLCIPQLLTKLEKKIPQESSKEIQNIPKSCIESIRPELKNHMKSVEYLIGTKQHRKKKTITLVNIHELETPLRKYIAHLSNKKESSTIKGFIELLTSLCSSLEGFSVDKKMLEKHYTEDCKNEDEKEIRIYSERRKSSKNPNENTVVRKPRSYPSENQNVKKIKYDSDELNIFRKFIEVMAEVDCNISQPVLQIIETILYKQSSVIEESKVGKKNAMLLLSLQSYLIREDKNEQVSNQLKNQMQTVIDNC